MAMKRCSICGEKYSDSYRDCPFCEEEEALLSGKAYRSSGRSSRRGSRSRQYSLVTPTLIVLILIMAGLLVYLLYGDQLAEKFKKDDLPSSGAESVIPSKPVEEDDPEETTNPNEGVMPEDPGETTDPGSDLTYEQLSQLPGGLSISKTDFTLESVGRSHTLTASGGSGSYTWVSEDEGIVSVDENGKVVAVSGGTTNVLVTDGEKKAVCIVRVRGGSGSSGQTSSGGETTSGLKAGAGEVVNGGNGVRVRSGPSTNHEILATVPNGASVQIVESAGDGWYKITFSGPGGATTPGYMKGDYLANK